VVAFDLLVQLYAEERRLAESERIPREWTVPEPEVAGTIVECNLSGIDIDSRAIQIAALALYLKAKEHRFDPTDGPPRLNLVAADAVLTRGTAYETLLAQYNQDSATCEAIEAIWHALEHVRDLGSLVRVDEEVDAAVRKAKMKEDRHSPLLSSAKDWDAYKQTLFNRLLTAFEAEAQSADVTARIFGREGEKGVGLVELLSRRYDVVCTNPPYMGSKNMEPVLKTFVAKHYAPGKRDLYAAFILRCRELAVEDGYVAMVTQQSWMFLRSYAELRSRKQDSGFRCQDIGESGPPGVSLRRKTSKSQFLNARSFGGLLRETSIEALAHLGPGAFAEISGEVVNIALFTLRNAPPTPEHKMVALRLVGVIETARKAEILSDQNRKSSYAYIVPQTQLAQIHESPVLYWFDRDLLGLLTSGKRIAKDVHFKEGLNTTDNPQFLHWVWEVPSNGERWHQYAKGGGYRKWHGLEHWVVDWENKGARMKRHVVEVAGNQHWSRRLIGLEYFSKPGLTYSLVCRGSLSVRFTPGYPFDSGAVFVSTDDIAGVGAVLNSRVASYILRGLCPDLKFREGYVGLLPWRTIPQKIRVLAQWAFECKPFCSSCDPCEYSFLDSGSYRSAYFSEQNGVYASILACEGWIEELVFQAYELDSSTVLNINTDLGIPAGWHRLIAGYDALPELPLGLPPTPQDLNEHLAAHARLSPSPPELERLKDRLRGLYIAGPGAKVEDEASETTGDNEASDDDEEEQVTALGARIPIPAETFLEELSQKLEIHPISVYWLLEEMRREEGLICPPELKRHTEDYFSVKLLRMLGHRWPLQDQYEQDAGKPFLDPKWIDADRIMPLTLGTGEETLIERFRRFLDDEFGPERGPSVEIEAGQILGWKTGDVWGQQKSTTLARWFEHDFFNRHISQFKRRPIAWHLTSPKSTFQTIVYYHAFDKNRLTLLRARYVREALESLRKQLGAAQGAGTDRRALAAVAELEAKIADVQAFDERLRRLLEGRDRESRIWCPWKTLGEQPVGWDPDINDGVRVNIAPVQRLGLLAANVLSAKDLKSLLAPEGRS